MEDITKNKNIIIGYKMIIYYSNYLLFLKMKKDISFFNTIVRNGIQV